MAFKTAFIIKWRGGSLSGGKRYGFKNYLKPRKVHEQIGIYSKK